MNRLFVLTLGFLFALGAAAYGQTFTGNPDFQNPRILAGQVQSDGSIVRGSHFTVQHLQTGEYKVRFDRGYFLNACPVVTVTEVGANLIKPGVHEVVPQVTCSRTFQVDFYNLNSLPRDISFNFVAVGTE